MSSTTPHVAISFLDQYLPVIASQLKQVNATTVQNELYGAIDLSGASWLERTWASYYIWMGNPVLATGFLSFFVHETVYFGRAIPWLFVDMIPYFQQYKLQPNKHVTAAQIWKCTKVVLITHFTCELPIIFVFHPICCFFGMATYEVPFSPVPLMLAQIAFFFVFEDMYHYWFHRALHWGPLYKYIHKIHHEFSAPIGLAAEYAHPLEVLILALGTVLGPFIYCVFRSDLHISTVYIWVALRLFQAVDSHSGYDFPWSLRQWLPFWAGADHHDFHHQAFVNCYATSFRWWDYMLGTDNKYHAYKARVAAANPKERAAVEKVEMEAVEREGLRVERIAGMGGGEGGMEGVKCGKLE